LRFGGNGRTKGYPHPGCLEKELQAVENKAGIAKERKEAAKIDSRVKLEWRRVGEVLRDNTRNSTTGLDVCQ